MKPATNEIWSLDFNPLHKLKRTVAGDISWNKAYAKTRLFFPYKMYQAFYYIKILTSFLVVCI